MPIKIPRLENAFPLINLKNKSWARAEEVLIDKYWSSENAPVDRHLKARLLWSGRALYVRFEANQSEPLIVSEVANTKTKTLGLWNRDVCEIFLASDKNDPRRYFEFEIAPNGEWIDLEIHHKSGERVTVWDYQSGMQTAARIEKDKILMAMKIEWKAFGRTPKTGDVWLGNILRCVGAGARRGYLAWQPTLTKTPNFHVPERFGEFIFVK